ncbi:TPA: hypothetical protein ACGOVD_001215 [Streptococcus suis]
MFDTDTLNPLDVQLDYDNPRFSMFEFENEEDIIKYLIDFEQIKELAFQIGENGYNTIGERIIVLKVYSGEKTKYTVLEGNRRIASLKLLFQYPHLLKSSDRKKLEQLKLNVDHFLVPCDIVEEEARDEAVFKISAKHVEGIKTWSATDKKVFYHNLYIQYRKNGFSSNEALDKIKDITPEGKVAIRNAIQQLNYLTSVYNATQIYKPDLDKLTHLDTDVLVSRILRPLIKELNLEFNDDLQVIAKNEKVYKEILGMLGKAVWIDKKLDTRVFSVQGQWVEIVENDEVVPGLAEKIKEYKEFEKVKPSKEESPNNPPNKSSITSEDGEHNGEKIELPGNNTLCSVTDDTDTQKQGTKYKFFVPRESVTINKINHNLTEEVTLFDENDNEVPRQSSEYNRISFSCAHQNIVLDNNVINPISENGVYTINVEYDTIKRSFSIFLNVAVSTPHQEYQVLFNNKWYDESLAKLSSKHEYFKICEVIKKLQSFNVLSADIGDHIIIAFLLRNLIEYSTKAYSDLLNLKHSQDKLSPLVSAVKNHLVTTTRFSRTEAKALNNHDMDIELLNGLIHDYRTSVSITNIQSIGQKFNRYFSVIFDKLYEGVNNG